MASRALGSDFVGIIHESVEGEAETINENGSSLIGVEVGKLVGFESQPETFDGIEVGTVGREELVIDVMEVQAIDFVPTGVIEDEDTTFAGERRHS